MKAQNNGVLFACACSGMLLFGISLTTLGAVAPVILQRFDLEAAAAGSLFSVLPFGIMAGSLAFGPAADRFGYKIILVVSCLAMFAGFEGIAHLQSFPLLTASVFFFGLGGGAINGASNALVSDISAGDRGANLSLLGVFYAIGALGMPFILAVAGGMFGASTIVSMAGFLTLAVGTMFLLLRFPEPKLREGMSFSRVVSLAKDPALLLIAFFLFCQSGFEGIVNNWTTTYLTASGKIESRDALFALTIHVSAMAVTRILLGSALRRISSHVVIALSVILLITGALLLQSTTSYGMSVTSLILLGAGLAAGFPVMLGHTGNRFSEVSGTAFSIVITIALAGNTVINYTLGKLISAFGNTALPLAGVVLAIFMGALAAAVRLKINQPKYE